MDGSNAQLIPSIFGKGGFTLLSSYGGVIRCKIWVNPFFDVLHIPQHIWLFYKPKKRIFPIKNGLMAWIGKWLKI